MDLRSIPRIGGAHGNIRFHGPPPIGAGVDSLASEKAALIDPYRHLKALSMALSVGIHAAALACFFHTAALRSISDQATAAISVDVVSAAAPQRDPAETPRQAEQALPQPEPVSPKMIVPERLSADLPSRPPAKVHRSLKPQQTTSDTASVTFGQSDTAPDSPSISANTESADSTRTTSGEPSGKADDRLRVYGQMVWASIMAHKPAGIRLRGTVTLTFSLLRDGRLGAAAVSTSSGSDSLDQVALAALHDAAQFPPPPEGMSGQSLTFSIPFQFR